MSIEFRRRRSRLFLAALLFVPFGCGEGRQPETAAKGQPSMPETGSATPSEAVAEAPLTPAEVAQVTTFGVPECDSYVAKYVACVEANVTGEEKEKLLAGFEANRTRWRALATMREGAVALGLACRAAAQKAKEDLSVEFGCSF